MSNIVECNCCNEIKECVTCNYKHNICLDCGISFDICFYCNPIIDELHDIDIDDERYSYKLSTILYYLMFVGLFIMGCILSTYFVLLIRYFTNKPVHFNFNSIKFIDFVVGSLLIIICIIVKKIL